MKYENSTVKSERVRELLLRAGISIGDFSKSLWGPRSHNSLTYFDARPDIKVSTLVKMAEILGCSIEDILIKSDSSSDSPARGGADNTSGTGSANIDITTLKAEIKALKMLIEEKNLRIEDLKSANSELGRRLDLVLQLGQDKDRAERERE